MTTKTFHPWLIAFAALTATAAAPAPFAIHIAGNAVQPSDWTIDDLQTRFAADITPIEYTTKGVKHTFTCVPLISLLKAAGVQTDFTMHPSADPKLKNPQLREAVIVTGRDGYTVVFSLAEILPPFGNRQIWLALKEDGHPLPDPDGPTRLLVPEDKIPARGVHQIASISVEELTAPTTQPQSP